MVGLPFSGGSLYSLRLALFEIMAMALLHRAGMSSRLDGSGSCRTSLACVWVCLVCWGSVVVGVLVFGLGSMFLAVFLSRVMRSSCLASDFVMVGVVLCLCLLEVVEPLAISFGLGCGIRQWLPPAVLPLCQFRR